MPRKANTTRDFLEGFDPMQFWLLNNWSLCLVLEKLEAKEDERGGEQRPAGAMSRSYKPRE